PGEEEAAERLVECLFSNDHIWGDTSERALQEELTEPVTVAGMPGYRHRAVVTFGQHDLTRTDSTEIVAVVVATPEGPSAFISEIAVGVTEHEEGAEEAYASLTGIGGSGRPRRSDGPDRPTSYRSQARSTSIRRARRSDLLPLASSQHVDQRGPTVRSPTARKLAARRSDDRRGQAAGVVQQRLVPGLLSPFLQGQHAAAGAVDLLDLVHLLHEVRAADHQGAFHLQQERADVHV